MSLLVLLPLAADPVPTDDDVVAGPWGAIVIGFLIVATALLLWAFTRQLRRAERAGLPSKKADERGLSADTTGIMLAAGGADTDGPRHGGAHHGGGHHDGGRDSGSDSANDSGGGSGGDSGGGDGGGGGGGGGD